MPQKYDKHGDTLAGYKPTPKDKLAALAASRAVIRKSKGRDAAEADEGEKPSKGKKA